MGHPVFTEEHDLIRAQLRRFVAEKVKSEGPKWEQAGFVPRQVLREMGGLGFFSLRIPEELGGAGLDARASVILAEEVGRSTYGGFAITVLVHTDMASPHLVRFGSKRQLDKYLPGIMAGTTITAVAVTEPGAGSDVASIRTRAVRDGDSYVLNGAKMFITNGVHGDLYFVAARTDPEAKGSRALTMFIVEKGTPGFRVSRALAKTGWLSSDTAELVFEDCRVPAENILGEENRGFYSIMANFQNERLVIGAMAMAEAREAIRITFDYVNQRAAFGEPLWEKQTIRQRLARRLAEVDAARQLVHHTAWLDAQGTDCVAQVSMVKALAGDLVNAVLYDCVQFHGGMGFMRESAIERMARDARVQAIGGGASEVMLEEVAKRFGQVLSD
ncbi:MAG: acyl-CoA dehydrogenase family protein [Alphaproteobacteria bacterium]|nr:acyl-CoA dehydrogenase family protein [Alphaproteobacteria bacterium]